MSKIAEKLTDLIGNTPLLALNNYGKALGLPAKVLAKLEYFNPAGSAKDRIAIAMIEAAEKELGDSGRVLVRASGTEPLVRVMLEGRNKEQIEKLAAMIAQVVEERLI